MARAFDNGGYIGRKATFGEQISSNMGVWSLNAVYNSKLLPGLSADSAATSAAQIYAAGGRTDGIYWINLPNVGPTRTYCALSSDFAGGGGWMLALKATTGTTFAYTANYWTTTNTLNPSDLTRLNADAKYNVFNYYTASKFMAFFPDLNNGGMTSGAGTGWHWLVTGQNMTCLNRFQTSTQLSSSPRDSGSMYIGSGFSNQGGYQSWDFNYVGNSAASVRWGFGWNNEGDQSSNDVSSGIGMSSNYGSYSAGDKINCCQSTYGVNRSARVEIWVQ